MANVVIVPVGNIRQNSRNILVCGDDSIRILVKNSRSPQVYQEEYQV